MKPAFLRILLALLLLAMAGTVSARPDAGPSPLPYKHSVRFSKLYNPDLKPERTATVVMPAHLVYPKKWHDWGQPAYAVVEFLVADTGYPREVQCSEATDQAFAKEAIRTIEKSVFHPALKNQQGCYSKVVLRLEFKLPTAEASPAAPAAPAAK